MKIIRKQIVTRVLTLVMSVALMLTVSPVYALAAGERPQKGYVVTSSYKETLNIRAKASTKSKILATLEAGDLVCITGEEGRFYQIEYSDGIAYVAKSYIRLPEKSSDEYELVAAAVVTSSSNKNRNHNLNLACQTINGRVLEPGEQFDWYANGVGQATKEKGYKIATIFVNGQNSKGYGGGVCQVSTALYNAIDDLDIVPDELHHHSKEVTYIQIGMDATVSYGSKNFVFTNTKDYSIQIESFSAGGRVTILLYKVL